MFNFLKNIDVRWTYSCMKTVGFETVSSMLKKKVWSAKPPPWKSGAADGLNAHCFAGLGRSHGLTGVHQIIKNILCGLYLFQIKLNFKIYFNG